METKQPLKVMSKKELAAIYGVNPKMLRSWLKKIPNLSVTPEQKKLTLKQLRIIFDVIGEP